MIDDIDDALFTIREDMARLVAAMRAKGHAKATASIRITDGGLCIHLDTEVTTERAFAAKWGRESSYVFPSGETYTECLREARDLVDNMALSEPLARLAEAEACAAWFVPVASAEAA